MRRFSALWVALICVVFAGACPDEETSSPLDSPYLPEEDPRCLSVDVGENGLTLTFSEDAAGIGLAEGHVVAGHAQGGYLRTIVEIVLSGDEAWLGTSPASMVDAVETGSLHETWVAPDLGGDLTGTVIFDGYSNVAELFVELVDGSLAFAPDVVLDAEVEDGNLSRLQYEISGTLAAEMTVDLSLVAPFSYTTEQVLSTTSEVFSAEIGGLPVEGELITELVGGVEIVALNGGSFQGSVVVNADVTLGAVYEGGQWTETWTNAAEASSGGDPVWDSPNTLSTRVWLRPQVRLMLYGRPGASAGVAASVGGELTQVDPDAWIVDAGVGGIGVVSASVFDAAVDDLDFEPDAETVVVSEGVADLDVYEDVGAGDVFTCGLLDDGTVTCWGDDADGQSSPPAGSFEAIAAGSSHACALDAAGAVTCWGEDEAVQTTPKDDRFTQISAGSGFTCGVRDDGTLLCWGSNLSGQCDAPEGTFSVIAAGAYHACGMDDQLLIHCWGSDGGGQASPPPMEFDALSGGIGFTCGLRALGDIQCWGCGLTDDGECEPPGGTFTHLSAGRAHACALRDDGSAVCWGRGDTGQTNPPAATPFSRVSAGGQHSCGVTTDNEIECWGRDNQGQATPP